MSEDSDSDSDYEPIADNDDNDADEKTEKIVETSSRRKRKATELWNAMVEEDEKQVKIRMSSALYKESSKKSPKLKKKHQKKLNNMLTQIFGKSNVPSSGNQQLKEETSTELRERALESVKSIQRDRKIVETRKFAGQSIQVERNLKAGETVNESEQKSGEVSSLDKVLTEIKGPQTISTVTKSSFDWEGYKTTEGIEEDLASAAKEGYLTRKEFLERCDYRQFEKERDERLAKAASRMK